MSGLREDIQALLVRSWERRYSVKASEIMAVVAPRLAARDAEIERLDEIAERAAKETRAAARKIVDVADARDAAVEQLERLHSWGGLLELLDEHWPTDIFPAPESIDAAKSQTRRDTGPVILGLIRWVDKLSADLAAARQQLDRVRAEAADAALKWAASECHREARQQHEFANRHWPEDNPRRVMHRHAAQRASELEAAIRLHIDAPARTEVAEVNPAGHDESRQST